MNSVQWPRPNSASRRALLALAGATLLQSRPIRAHARAGPVSPPRAAPPIIVRTSEGRETGLGALLAGHTTALQLMFTGCTATCPLQGAIFADLQQRLTTAPAPLRLLSLSVDPLSDDSAALRAWLARHGAQPHRWLAAAPRIADLDKLLDFLGRRPGDGDTHPTQAFLFDRRGRLVFASTELPTGVQLARLLIELDAAP